MSQENTHQEPYVVLPANLENECESCGAWCSPKHGGVDDNGECLICANLRQASGYATDEIGGGL